MKENYDKVILGVGGVALLAALAFVFLKATGVEQEVGYQAPPQDVSPIQNYATTTQNYTRVFLDARVPFEGEGLFVGPEIREQQTVDGTFNIERVAGGMTDDVSVAWIEGLKMNVDDQKIGSKDHDGDGFITKEEYNPLYVLGQENPATAPEGLSTSPIDANDYPAPHHRRMFFTERKEERYVLSFRARPDDVTMQINRDFPIVRGQKRGYLARVGDTLWSRFTVVRYDEENDSVVLKDNLKGKDVVLPRRQPVNLPEYTGVFKVVLFGKGEQQVEAKAGDEITFPGVTKYVYKVNTLEESEAEVLIDGTPIKLPITTDDEIKAKLGE